MVCPLLASLADVVGRINFEIYVLLASVFQRMQDFRAVLYELAEIKTIQLFISNKVCTIVAIVPFRLFD